MVWVDPLYSRTAVRRAGAAFIAPDTDPVAREEARIVINNWRSAHGFPLNSMQMVLRHRASKVDPDATVAQRIKRLPSITQKLVRFQSMELDRMQDIGGCRAVVEDLGRLKDLEALYRTSRSSHRLVRTDDYVWDKPKLSGYRSLHLVYGYQGAKKSHENLKIEIELRTRMQHAWATALETVYTFTAQALKASKGKAAWLRFFALMASEIAHLEGTSPVPGTPDDRQELVNEIRALAKKIQVVDRLRAYGMTLNFTEQNPPQRGDRYFVLVLEPDTSDLTLYAFPDLPSATAYYDATESVAVSSRRDIVLVAVGATASLRRAYPNYFLDTDYFLNLVLEVLD
jgi:hypothetical protein